MSYNNSAMDTLMNAGGGAVGSPKSDAAPAPQNDVESVNIRKADNGWIVDVTRASGDSTNGPAEVPSKSPKPQLAKSDQELMAILAPLFSGAGAQQEEPPAEDQPPADNEDASADNEREGVDSAP